MTYVNNTTVYNLTNQSKHPVYEDKSETSRLEEHLFKTYYCDQNNF